MDVKQISEFPRQTVEQLLSGIPFYKTVKQQDRWQFETLLQASRIVTFEPGEPVLKVGERDSWLYFLLKGQLAVYVTEDIANAEVVNYITPGEVFGDLAMLVGAQRSATLVADPNCRVTSAFATDFTVFGELNDFRAISLPTKLTYFRNTVHNLRWKLEVYRMKFPQQELASHHHKVKLFTGAKDSYDELLSLHAQAVALAKLLMQWNEQFGALPISADGALNPQVLAGIE